MAGNTRIDAMIGEIIKETRPRAPSLIVTVLGDSIAPRGGSFWIGSLIALMAPFGINERLVRTSTFRLTKEDWLTSIQIGRRSYYSLTPTSLRRFAEAFHRVYDYRSAHWDGNWTLLLIDPAGLTQEERDRIRQNLGWLGFGMAAPSIFAHTAIPTEELRRKLDDLGLTQRAVVMDARLHSLSRDLFSHDDGTAAFVRRFWDLEKLAADYGRFLELFRPLWQALRDNDSVTPEQAFRARTLLIHEFRRITLRDPQLPEALLPPHWEGTAARLLTRNLYRALDARTESYLKAAVETADGPLSGPGPDYYERFGGIRADTAIS